MRIFNFVNQTGSLPMDELPPSGLQNLFSGFRLVDLLLPGVEISSTPYHSVLKWCYRPDHVSIQSIA